MTPPQAPPSRVRDASHESLLSGGLPPIRRWRSLADRGNTAVEFALLGPLLVLVVLLIFEVGMQAAVAAALDYGARRASRLGIIGAVVANGPVATDTERRSALRKMVVAATGGLLADGRLTLAERSFDSVSEAGAQREGILGPGGGGQVVRYELTYTQPLVTGSLAAAAFQRTEFVHVSTITVVNELFPRK